MNKNLQEEDPPDFCLTRSEMIAALNCEIAQIENENKRPGWSAWALQGGIATFIWLILSDFSSKSSNLQTIGIIFLAGLFSGEFLLGVFQYLTRLENFQNKQLRYRFSSEDPNLNPAYLVFTLFRYCLILFIYFSLGSKFHVKTLVAYSSVVILFCFFGLLLRFLKILSSNKTLSEKAEHLITMSLLSWGGFIGSQFIVKISAFDEGLSGADFRVGLLLVGIIYLISLLITGERERPVVNKLKMIRRKLSFGQTNVKEALKATDIALSGLTQASAIEHKLMEISNDLQNVALRYEKLIAKCGEARLFLERLEADANQEAETWKKAAREVALILDSCETERAVNQQLFNTAFHKTKSSLQSIKRYQASNPFPQHELASQWDSMKRKMEKMLELYNSIPQIIEELMARYKAIS